jgi:hypothetical protein
LSLRFSKIDPLSFSDHYYLDQDDTCYHLGEYTAKRGYAFSETNRIICNLKKRPNAKASELYWKNRAVASVAKALREALNSEANRDRLRLATLIPVPPSAIIGDPLHDDRMVRVLNIMGHGLGLDVRELVKQHRSVAPVHESQIRPSPTELADNYYIDESCANPAPRGIWIFDDLITAGSHYKAVQSVIIRRFPGIPTIGIFVARRVPETDVIEDGEFPF